MSYADAVNKLLREDGVEQSTMMNSPCLRYRGEFLTMMFARENCLIIKVGPERVDELIKTGIGRAFDFTGKRFREWVLIPADREREYENFIREALDHARQKERSK